MGAEIAIITDGRPSKRFYFHIVYRQTEQAKYFFLHIQKMVYGLMIVVEGGL